MSPSAADLEFCLTIEERSTYMGGERGEGRAGERGAEGGGECLVPRAAKVSNLGLEFHRPLTTGGGKRVCF